MKKIVFFIIILTLFSACKKNISSKTKPKAINGIIDLHNWDFAEDGIVQLDGEWKFYWNKLYSPDELKKTDLQQSAALIKAPLSWNGQKINGEVLGSYGYATYSLKILLNETKKDIFIKFPTAGTAYEFYANGKKIMSGGKVGTSFENMIAGYAPQIVHFTPEKNELDIVVHVSNFNEQYGGLWYSINIGTGKDISRLRENNIILEMIMFGIFIIMALYYLGILALRKDDKLPLYFALFCFLLAARILFTGEFLIVNLFPGISVENIKRCQYLTYFLGTPALGFFLLGSFPKEIYKSVTIFVSIVSIVFSGIVIFTGSRFFTFIISYFQLFNILCMFYYVYTLILAIKRKRIGSIILSIGAFSFLLGVFNDILLNQEIINTFESVQYGLLMFIFSQSLMMSKRFSSAFLTVERLSLDLEIKNTQLAELNLTLEEKVKDRTEELEAANQEMIVINEELIMARDSLWSEMEVAKKIQSVLLPKKPMITDYEISAYMKPADEVGGDYYDVINIANRDWLVIGDVSGHGLPAGLIMMMVQTAIHSVIQLNPELPPSVLLSVINKTINQNIHKLDDDKYMTITVFAVFEDGKIHFSGLHQNILIYRKQDDTVDIIQTNGMWIGMLDDIQDMLTDEKLTMKNGDMMLLYTDGITEAWEKGGFEEQRDPEKAMFGESKLKNILQEHGKKSPEDVKNKILSAIEEYETNDDVTIFLIKRS